MEICEDFWAATPPSTVGALAGATILANLSASNITIGKSDERHMLCRSQDIGLVRPIRRFPYVPNRKTHLHHDCYEAFNIQVEGLRRRFEATSGTHMVIGVSGGLDSTHALIVAAKVCDRLGLPRSTILGFTMPGFATGEATKGNAWKLMRAVGITAEEIDIRPTALQMLHDMGHPFAEGEPVYDVAFENALRVSRRRRRRRARLARMPHVAQHLQRRRADVDLLRRDADAAHQLPGVALRRLPGGEARHGEAEDRRARQAEPVGKLAATIRRG